MDEDFANLGMAESRCVRQAVSGCLVEVASLRALVGTVRIQKRSQFWIARHLPHSQSEHFVRFMWLMPEQGVQDLVRDCIAMATSAPIRIAGKS
jgi:hypothetical protein